MYPLSNIYGFLVEHLHFNSGLNGTLFHTKYSFFVELSAGIKRLVVYKDAYVPLDLGQ